MFLWCTIVDRVDKLFIVFSITVSIVLATGFVTDYIVFWKILTLLGEEYLYVVISLFIYVFYSIDYGFYSMLSVLMSGVLSVYLKNVFHTQRPPESLWKVKAEGYGFPSGHAMVSTSFYTLVSSIYRRRTLYLLSTILVLGIGFSRVFLRVHYLCDVVGGWFFGFVVGFVVYLFSKYESRFVLQSILPSMVFIFGAINWVFYNSIVSIRIFYLLCGLITYYPLKLLFRDRLLYLNKACFRVKAMVYVFIVVAVVALTILTRDACLYVNLFSYLISGFLIALTPLLYTVLVKK